MNKNVVKIAFGVDILNGFAHPLGGLYVPGGENVIAPANKIISHIHSLPNGLVFLAADSHPRNSKHFKINSGKWPVHCIKGSWDALFHENLLVPPNAKIFYKGINKDEDGYNPWEGKNKYGRTPLDVIYDIQGLDSVQIFFFGIATNFCVRAGVLTAYIFKRFEVYLVADACRAVENVTPPDPTEQEAIEEMRAAGAIITTTDEVINGTQ